MKAGGSPVRASAHLPPASSRKKPEPKSAAVAPATGTENAPEASVTVDPVTVPLENATCNYALRSKYEACRRSDLNETCDIALVFASVMPSMS